MCLGVPGKILSIQGADPLTRTGRVSFGGIIKDVNLAYVPEARVGHFVIVHVGFAISTVDEAEAAQVFEYLAQMDELRELDVSHNSRNHQTPHSPGPPVTNAGSGKIQTITNDPAPITKRSVESG